MCPLFVHSESKERYAPCDLPEGYDVGTILKKRHQIAQIWSVEDVLALRPDLSEEQAWIVLQQVDRRQEANFGIDWHLIEYVSDVLYPKSYP